MAQTLDLVAKERLPRRRELTSRMTGDEIVVHNPTAGRLHFLNRTATIVWQACDGATTLDECLEQIRTRCEIPADVDLRADVREVLQNFTQNGLLEDQAASA